MGEPRTTREALIAELLGDLDELLTRAEQLPTSIAEAEKRLTTTARVLHDAGDKYRLTVTLFTEEAKSTLHDYLQQKALQITALTIEEQRAILREAARGAFQFAASERADQIESDPGWGASNDREHPYRRLLEHGVTALLASVVTAVLVLVIVHLR